MLFYVIFMLFLCYFYVIFMLFYIKILSNYNIVINKWLYLFVINANIQLYIKDV